MLYIVFQQPRQFYVCVLMRNLLHKSPGPSPEKIFRGAPYQSTSLTESYGSMSGSAAAIRRSRSASSVPSLTSSSATEVSSSGRTFGTSCPEASGGSSHSTSSWVSGLNSGEVTSVGVSSVAASNSSGEMSSSSFGRGDFRLIP